MAVLIPEAAAAVGEGGAAVEGTAAGAGTGASGAVPKPGKAGKPKTAVLGGGGQDQGGGKKKAKGGGKSRRSFGHGHYQPVILAEFLVAIIIVSVSPLAKGGDSTAQAKGGPSPYSTDTMKQLIAIGGTYFVLALLSGGKKTGRYAAWFGALVLLGLGFAELLNGDLKALFGIFGPGSWQGLDPGAAAAGAVQGAVGGAPAGTAVVPNPDATGGFPTIEPGGQIVPGNVTQSFVSPPPGGTGVTTTTGNDQGVNLAL